MKMIDKQAFQEIDTWINQNARPLELALWNYDWKQGSKEAVVNALAYYQNPDGGFSNTVEPDSWNPDSTPYALLIALGMLRKIGFVEEAGTDHPMIQGMFKYLESGKYSNEEGWHFSVPSNDNYAHAPWWTYSEELNQVQDMGITAGLCSFILRFGDPESAVYEKAVNYTRGMLKRLEGVDDFGEMGAGGLYGLLMVLEPTRLGEEFPCEALKVKIEKVMNSLIERDPEKWSDYTPRPSQYIPAPFSPLYQGNEDIVDRELDYLIDTRPEGGVWGINWCWFETQEQYAREFAISENWWKAVKAIEKMEFLRTFGRVE